MIKSEYFTLAIMLMTMITFSVRYVFFMTSLNMQLNDKIKTILLFTAPCVLTTMIVPIMFQDLLRADFLQEGWLQTNGSMSVLSSGYLLASVCAIVFSRLMKNTLLVIVLSMLVFYGVRFMG